VVGHPSSDSKITGSNPADIYFLALPFRAESGAVYDVKLGPAYDVKRRRFQSFSSVKRVGYIFS